MSIALKLDTAAVERLIGDDPELIVDLQRAVVANVIKKSIFKDIGRDLSGLVDRAASGLVSELGREASMQLRDQAMIERVIGNLTRQELAHAMRVGKQDAHKTLSPKLVEALQDRASELAQEIIAEKLPEITQNIEARLEARMNGQLAEMTRQFQRRLDELGNEWKTEAATQIRTDVVARLNGALAG